MKGIFLAAATIVFLVGCGESQPESRLNKASVTDNDSQVNSAQPVKQGYPDPGSFADDISENPYAYIPPQCFTNPKDADGSVKNPCYACHTLSKEPNFFDDVDVQLAYAFPENVTKNHWVNIYKDRSGYMSKLADETVVDYVRGDNYFSQDGKIKLADKLANPPKEWDRNKNGRWDGFVPDVYFNFDTEGFDKSPSGQYTGWRAFAYYPFEGTFFPTNGSTDDVMIRLDAPFQQNESGAFDLTVYKVNLAIVEALIKTENVNIDPVDERDFGVDLDKNGKLNTADRIVYDWAPLEKRFMSYVGRAKKMQETGELNLAARLYPEGTEFAHSVRYLDVQGDKVSMAKRMKEFRYSKKVSWRTYYKLREVVVKELKERHDFPDRLKTVFGNMEQGMSSQYGWVYQGFIEDAKGELRPQTYEETLFCMGCHSNIGAQTDTTLSFARKFDSADFQRGWYHWNQKGLEGVQDYKREDGIGRYAYYLAHNPAGNEYRTNDEVKAKFFHEDGKPRAEAFARLDQDISFLLMPSAERALQLNKAYKAIVDEQSYKFGRDAILVPHNNVHREIETEQATGITETLTRY